MMAALAVVASALVIFPFVRHWTAREEQIAVAERKLGELRWLAQHRDEMVAAAGRRGEQSDAVRTFISGRTPALASSSLQRALQRYAESSGLSVNSLDVAGAPDSSPSPIPVLPATLSGVGDIFAVTDFLSALRKESPVMDVNQLTVVSNSALRDGLLRISLAVRAPAVIR